MGLVILIYIIIFTSLLTMSIGGRVLQLGEQNIHGRLKFLVVLSGLRCVDELQQREEVLFFRLRLVPDVPDQGAVQKALGLDPKILGGFFPVAFGVGDDDIDQL